MLISRTFVAAIVTAAVAFVPLSVAAPGGPKLSDSVVKSTVTADKPDASGKQVVTVTLAIDKGWHIYANPVPNDEFPGVPTTLTFDKVKAENVKISYPPGKKVKDATIGDYSIYEDKVEIKATVQRGKDDTGPLKMSIRFQACSDRQCLMKSDVKLHVP